jgi:hypothetical protein
MKEKVEQILKFTPVITLICYICGFIIYNTFLLQYGIIDTNIFNLKFIEAGILYLLIAPFILATPLITNKKMSFLGSIFTSLFAFMIYNNLFGNSDLRFIWKAYLVVIGFNSLSYIIIKIHRDDIKMNLYDLTETPLLFFMFFILSLLLFSTYFKEVKVNFGGGKNYKKVLILNEKKDNLIKTDSLFHTDTLSIIYENNDFIYYKKSNSVMSLRKEIVEGEIIIK